MSQDPYYQDPALARLAAQVEGLIGQQQREIEALKLELDQLRTIEHGRGLYSLGVQMNTSQDDISDTSTHVVNTVNVAVPAGGILVVAGAFDVHILTRTGAASLYFHTVISTTPDSLYGGNADGGMFPEIHNTGRMFASNPLTMFGGYDSATTVTIDQTTRATSTNITYRVYTTWTRIAWLIFL